MEYGKIKPKLKILIAAVVLFSLTASLAQAALVTCGRRGAGTDSQPCELTGIVLIAVRLINLFLGISWLIALFFIFWGGYNLATSAGNEEKMKAARADFKNGVIGFFIIMMAFLLVDYLLHAFGGYSFSPGADNSIYEFLPGF
ncbi:MAG: hypothetical protein HYV13_01870 [Candidatus Doudnabacteria bacterium]|nr:hypothetical protein [Candidatus Doudnabacteria bacterium]